MTHHAWIVPGSFEEKKKEDQCRIQDRIHTTPKIVRIILINTVPLHTLSLAIHTANGGRIKLTKISNIFKQTPAIMAMKRATHKT